MVSGTDFKREEVRKAYPHSPTWRLKVRAMSDEQVIAVYLRLKAKGLIKGA